MKPFGNIIIEYSNRNFLLLASCYTSLWGRSIINDKLTKTLNKSSVINRKLILQ